MPETSGIFESILQFLREPRGPLAAAPADGLPAAVRLRPGYVQRLFTTRWSGRPRTVYHGTHRDQNIIFGEGVRPNPNAPRSYRGEVCTSVDPDVVLHIGYGSGNIYEIVAPGGGWRPFGWQKQVRFYYGIDRRYIKGKWRIPDGEMFANGDKSQPLDGAEWIPNPYFRQPARDPVEAPLPDRWAALKQGRSMI